MDLLEIRQRIDEIDNRLVELFVERMKITDEVAAYKKANGLPVLDRGREERILDKIALLAGEEFSSDAKELYERIFELSRAHQEELLK
ncbi:MAG: chorismate mutase [Clostridia bacterium]|nr:chorismate mutase [Clostridia bacterium]MBR4623664.1 chorismate mutase [Clostridia bacterium]